MQPPHAGTCLFIPNIITVHKGVSPLTFINWFSAPENGTYPLIRQSTVQTERYAPLSASPAPNQFDTSGYSDQYT